MKKLLSFLFLLGLTFNLSAQIRTDLRLPELNGYKVLKCDFHIHTVFSDGLVWPTVRVDEAYREGLDVIAISDHIEYRPHKDDIKASFNRSYDIAEKYAKGKGVTVIKGSEITRSMPPGHSNALFLSNCDSLDTPNYMDAFRAAKKQKAFIFWNHPGWDAQQSDTTLWWKEHSELFDGGYMHGIEVVNGNDYSPEAHQWCLDKKLTMLGNTDIHAPIQADYDFAKGEHRPMTLVFVRDNSVQEIREALENRRTVVYFQDKIVGEEDYVKELFENSIEILSVDKSEKNVRIVLRNKTDLPFKLKKTAHDINLVYFREYEIKPHGTHAINIKLNNGVKSGNVNFEVTNLLIKPNIGMQYSYPL